MMLTDKPNVLELAALMRAHGLTQVVLCPGSRNVPLVQTFSSLPDFTCFGVTDERSAGFQALGMALQTGKPAAVCCTSGTALLNLHPAVAEARYQQIPLLVISADRPRAWIDQMDGQTVHQHHAFDDLGIPSYDLADFHAGEQEARWYANRQINEALLDLRRNQPVHLNLQLSEPLFNFTVSDLPEVRHIRIHPAAGSPSSDWKGEIHRFDRILVIAGQMPPSLQKQTLPEGMVCLAGHLSNGRVGPAIPQADLILTGADPELERDLAPDLVITLGGHLVSKKLKQYLRRHAPSAHWQIDPSGKVTDLFCCLTDVLETTPEDFLTQLSGLVLERTAAREAYVRAWQDAAAGIRRPHFPFSSMEAVGSLLDTLPAQSVLHLANSSAVRYAQFYPLAPSIEVHCNRGTSGIEGSLSTAAGYATLSEKLNFMVIGDLSFLYDANALWSDHLSPRLRILLLNNGGGEIFKTLPHLDTGAGGGRFILGTHAATARTWTEEMGFQYASARNLQELREGIDFLTREDSPSPLILEVFTDSSRDAQEIKTYYSQLKTHRYE